MPKITIRYERERERSKISILEKEWESIYIYFFFIIIPLDCPSKYQNASVFPSRIKNPVTCNWHYGSNYDRLWNNNFFRGKREEGGGRVSPIKVERPIGEGGGKKTPPGNVDTSRRRIALFPEYRKTVTERIIIKKKKKRKEERGKNKKRKRREKERLR